MNSNAGAKAFRESFRGFNKEDVAAYIKELSGTYSEKLEEYKQINKKLEDEIEKINGSLLENSRSQNTELERLISDNKQMDSDINRLNAEIGQLKSESELKAAEADCLKAEIESLNDEKRLKDLEINRLNAELQTKSEEIKRLADKLELLDTGFGKSDPQEKKSAPILPLPKEDPEESYISKENLYKSASLNLGKVLLTAENTAEELVAEAKVKAEKIIALAKEEAAFINQKIREKTARIDSRREDIRIENQRLLTKFKISFDDYIARITHHADEIDANLTIREQTPEHSSSE